MAPIRKIEGWLLYGSVWYTGYERGQGWAMKPEVSKGDSGRDTGEYYGSPPESPLNIPRFHCPPLVCFIPWICIQSQMFHRKVPGGAGGMAEDPQEWAGKFSRNVWEIGGFPPSSTIIPGKLIRDVGQVSLGDPVPYLLLCLELSYERCCAFVRWKRQVGRCAVNWDKMSLWKAFKRVFKRPLKSL